jgi:hypothetical protein
LASLACELTAYVDIARLRSPKRNSPRSKTTTPMIRFFGRIWVKHAYIWKLEKEAAIHELSVRLSAKRALVEQLNQKPMIEANIKREEESEEVQSHGRQEKYEVPAYLM